MTPFDFRPRTRCIFGPGEMARLGEVARELGGTRCLLVADRSMVEAGYVQEASRTLKARRMEVFGFHEFADSPTSAIVDQAGAFAAPLNIDLIVGLGDGNSLDCAKGINFVLSNGGTLRNYWGYGKASRPMLPMVGLPATAGTGSEARSSAMIVDSETGIRMAAGDAKAAYRVAILDPNLNLSQPAAVAAAAGYDALSHAVETMVSTRRTMISECFSREAWRLVDANFERVLSHPQDIEARGAMLMGAHLGGLAIENSTVGAAHACAYPLSNHFSLAHGAALAVLLPHVVAWNRPVARAQYDELASADLVRRLREAAEAADLPLSLRDAAVPEEALPRLAEEASAQWVGRFNPRTFDANGALEIYRSAY